jgi:hypothetical protein
MKYMVCDVMAILDHEEYDGPLTKKYSQTLGVVAAMFHDCGHSVGQLSDPENVEIAVYCLRQACQEQEIAFLDRSNRDTIAEAIRKTVYHGGYFPKEPTTLIEKALRDADVFLPFHLHDAEGQELLLGLYHEIVSDTFDFPKWSSYLDGQIKFVTGVQYFTSYGKWMRTHWMTQAIERLRKLKQVKTNNWAQVNFHNVARHVQKWNEIRNNVQKLANR